MLKTQVLRLVKYISSLFLLLYQQINMLFVKKGKHCFFNLFLGLMQIFMFLLQISQRRTCGQAWKTSTSALVGAQRTRVSGGRGWWVAWRCCGYPNGRVPKCQALQRQPLMCRYPASPCVPPLHPHPVMNGQSGAYWEHSLSCSFSMPSSTTSYSLWKTSTLSRSQRASQMLACLGESTSLIIY